MNEKIFSKLTDILLEITENSESVQNMTKEDLLTKIGINSLNFLRLIVAVEDTFGFEFDNDYLDLNQFSDVQSLITYIESNIEE